MNVVVDANIVVKWFVDEAGSREAEDYLEHEGLLIAPAHLLGEVGETLRRSVRDGVTPPQQIDLARLVLPGSFVIVPLEDLFDRALEIGLTAGATIYDAFYVAAAERHDTFVVTSDLKLIRKLARTDWADRVRPLLTSH